MKERELLCLRCDWAGATKGDGCPSCGAGLFRPAAAASPPPRLWRGRRGGAERRNRTVVPRVRREEDAPSTEPDADAGASVDERSAFRSAVGLGTVVLVTVAAFVFVRATTPASPGAAGSPTTTGARGLSGVLLYTAVAPGPTGSRLWIWDLGTGSLREGPTVSNPRELVALAQAGPGSIGVTSGLPGGQEAWVLHNLGSGGHARAVLRGQLIAWSPGGGVVNSAAVHSPTGPCGRLIVRAYLVAEKSRLLRYEGHVCGRLAAFSRSTVLPFVALASNGGMTIHMVGNDSMLPVLHDHFLFGASTAGDFLVEPMSCIGPAPGPTASRCSGLQLFFPAPHGPRPVNIGVQGARLLAERVIGWTHDATAAYVLGTVGGRHGLYKVPVAPIEHPSDPELLFRTTSRDIQLSETFDGRVIVAHDGSFAIAEGGGLLPLVPPPGAPPPNGPMVWVPALPYSGT